MHKVTMNDMKRKSAVQEGYLGHRVPGRGASHRPPFHGLVGLMSRLATGDRRTLIRSLASILTATIVGLCWHPGMAAAQAPSPAGTDLLLSYKAAVARALANNLGLRMTRADTGSALAQLISARLRPNPSLAVEALSNGDRRVAVTQDLTLWGVRGNRIRAAEFDQARARLIALDGERGIRLEVATAYRRVLFLNERIVMLDSLIALDARVARVAKLAFQQGLGSELDERLSLAVYQGSLLDRAAALQEVAVGQIDLARVQGDSLTTRYLLTDSFPTAGLRFLLARTEDSSSIRYEPDERRMDSLVQTALASRPDLRAGQAAVDAQRATLAAAAAAGRPAIAIGAIYGRNLDEVAAGTGTRSIADNAVGVGLVIGLPLINRNQGEVARARFAGEAAGLRLVHDRQVVERDIRVAVTEVALSATQLETLRQVILPTTRSALRVAEAAFGRGQANIFQVLQVQRTYTDATTSLLDASRRYSNTLAELEAAVGAPIQ